MRLDERQGVPLAALVYRAPYDEPTLRRAADELRETGMITVHREEGAGEWDSPTAAGCDALERIVAARRAHIEEVFSQMTGEQRVELLARVRAVSRELVPDVRTGEHAAVRA